MNHVLHHECKSCPSEMSCVRDCIRKASAAAGFDEDTVEQLVLAVDEACTNIIRYAYEGNVGGKIEIDISTDPEMWEVRIRDYGKKGEASKLKNRKLEEVRPGGLGIFFIRKAFDKVEFDLSLEQGTCLILQKKRETKSGRISKIRIVGDKGKPPAA